MDQVDTLARTEERQDYRYNLTPSHDAVPLKMFYLHLDEALLRAAGNGESQDPF
jgi:hypothetical protein